MYYCPAHIAQTAQGLQCLSSRNFSGEREDIEHVAQVGGTSPGRYIYLTLKRRGEYRCLWALSRKASTVCRQCHYKSADRPACCCLLRDRTHFCSSDGRFE